MRTAVNAQNIMPGFDAEFKKITVQIDELQEANDAGLRAYITCPECGERVHIAENPWWDASCKCRKWSLRIIVVGEQVQMNHLQAGEE